MSAGPRTEEPRRRGLLSGMSVPPMDTMPPIRSAFARGLASTWASPLLVGATIGWLLVEWLVAVALGYPGPFAAFAFLSAPVPFSTLLDLTVFTGIFGVARGLFLVFAAGALHALWSAILTGLVVEAVESGRTSRWGAVRGLRAYPVSFALHVLGVPVLFTAVIVSNLAGSLGLLLQVGLITGVVWAFAFAPVIAVAERRRLVDALSRSLRAARLPGSGNLTFAAIYSLPVFAVTFALLVGSVPGAELDVNPPASAWLLVVGMNLLHTAVLGAFTIRYLAVAAEVPEAPAQRGPARRPSPDRGGARRSPRRR